MIEIDKDSLPAFKDLADAAVQLIPNRLDFSMLKVQLAANGSCHLDAFLAKQPSKIHDVILAQMLVTLQDRCSLLRKYRINGRLTTGSQYVDSLQDYVISISRIQIQPFDVIIKFLPALVFSIPKSLGSFSKAVLSRRLKAALCSLGSKFSFTDDLLNLDWTSSTLVINNFVYFCRPAQQQLILERLLRGCQT